MKYSEELGCYIDVDLHLSPTDIGRAIRYRRELPKRIQWFQERSCVSCGHLPTKDEFSDEASLKYFQTMRICQHCQNRIF